MPTDHHWNAVDEATHATIAMCRYWRTNKLPEITAMLDQIALTAENIRKLNNGAITKQVDDAILRLTDQIGELAQDVRLAHALGATNLHFLSTYRAEIRRAVSERRLSSGDAPEKKVVAFEARRRYGS